MSPIVEMYSSKLALKLSSSVIHCPPPTVAWEGEHAERTRRSARVVSGVPLLLRPPPWAPSALCGSVSFSTSGEAAMLC